MNLANCVLGAYTARAILSFKLLRRPCQWSKNDYQWTASSSKVTSSSLVRQFTRGGKSFSEDM
ncbi:hypothetical protein RIVM261_017550 [Rivularia sp. IAM M-261]|nr:hypothetical protein RIVM261_017550 [Rivularia sp. IAM M-261]